MASLKASAVIDRLVFLNHSFKKIGLTQRIPGTIISPIFTLSLTKVKFERKYDRTQSAPSAKKRRKLLQKCTIRRTILLKEFRVVL